MKMSWFIRIVTGWNATKNLRHLLKYPGGRYVSNCAFLFHIRKNFSVNADISFISYGS